VTPASDRFDQQLLAVTQRAAYVLQALYQRVVGDERIRPGGRDQLLFRNHAPGGLSQATQNLEGLRPQLSFFVTAPQGGPVEVDNELAEVEPVAALLGKVGWAGARSHNSGLASGAWRRCRCPRSPWT